MTMTEYAVTLHVGRHDVTYTIPATTPFVAMQGAMAQEIRRSPLHHARGLITLASVR